MGRWSTAFLLLLLAACGPRYPLDMTEEEWRTLSPEQRLAAREKEAELRRQREARRRAEEERRAAEARLAAQREAERIAERYRTAALDDFLICGLERGEARFGGDWGPFFGTNFTVLRGETHTLELTRTNGRDSIPVTARFYADGRRLRLCAGRSPFGGKNECVNLRAESRQFRRGVHKTLWAKKLFRGVELFCRRPKRRPVPPSSAAL